MYYQDKKEVNLKSFQQDGGLSFFFSQSASLANLLKNLFAGYAFSPHFLWKESRKQVRSSANNQKKKNRKSYLVNYRRSIVCPFSRHVTLKLGPHKRDSSYSTYKLNTQSKVSDGFYQNPCGFVTEFKRKNISWSRSGVHSRGRGRREWSLCAGRKTLEHSRSLSKALTLLGLTGFNSSRGRIGFCSESVLMSYRKALL